MGLFKKCVRFLALGALVAGAVVVDAGPSGAAGTYFVVSSDDSGPGSLRQAIIDINDSADEGAIEFDLTFGDRVIQLSSNLPAVLQPVSIDGTLVSKYDGAPLIEIRGPGKRLPGQGDVGACLELRGNRSVIRGLVIHGCGSAIRVTDAEAVVIDQNYLGVAPDGQTTPLGNNDGIRTFRAPGIRVGLPGGGNVIGGNTSSAVSLGGPDNVGSSNAQIQANLIGVGADGVTAAANGYGLELYGSANVRIGGTSPDSANVISGNHGTAIFSYAPGSGGMIVQGNFIGTDRSGTLALPNNSVENTFSPDLGNAAIVAFAANHLIGGTEPGAANVISGNRGSGIYLASLNARIVGNHIGVTPTGAPLGNGDYGIALLNAQRVRVGGVLAGEGNTIAFNGGRGVLIANGGFGNIFPTFGNSIRGNRIHSNGGIGIDLSVSNRQPSEVTPNDVGDVDGDPNGFQNFPVVNSITQSSTVTAFTTSVTATLSGPASTAYAIDYYASGSCDASGHGEGARHLGSTTATTGLRGSITFTMAVPRVIEGSVITMTATDPQGSTSEFSKCATVPVSSQLGYWTVTESGDVAPFSSPTVSGSKFFGSTSSTSLSEPISGLAPTPSGDGYRLVGRDGGVFCFGDADFYGSAADLELGAPIVRMASTPTGNGYWLVGADGGVFAFGDAGYFGSMGGEALNAPVIAIAATPSGRGYWLAAADGGIFAFGDAAFHGSAGATDLRAPVTALAARPDGRGYWMSAADGGVFSFGAAEFLGGGAELDLAAPVVAIASTPSGNGYWLLGRDGGVFSFGDAGFLGTPRDRTSTSFVGLAPQRGLVP